MRATREPLKETCYIPRVTDDAPDLVAEALRERPELVEPARRIFDYAKFLLDDDDKLTKTGALNGEARALLQKRILEVLG